MPYLDAPSSADGDRLEQGTWGPERGWGEWVERGRDPDPALLPWRRAVVDRRPPTPLPPLPDSPLRALPRARASAQRDGLFYTNRLEQLKDSRDDPTADAIVEHMQTLGLASA